MSETLGSGKRVVACFVCGDEYWVAAGEGDYLCGYNKCAKTAGEVWKLLRRLEKKIDEVMKTVVVGS